MKASTLHKRDNATRKSLGWGTLSWIPPKVPEPRTKAEEVCQLLLKAYSENAYMMHVYDVLDLMEQAYREGRVK